MGISETQNGYFWDSNYVFLRLKLCISGTQTTYFWDSNYIFLRLKMHISETQNAYFWDSKCIFLRLKMHISETQFRYLISERTDLDSLSSRLISNSIGSYISSFSKSMYLKMRYMWAQMGPCHTMATQEMEMIQKKQ